MSTGLEVFWVKNVFKSFSVELRGFVDCGNDFLAEDGADVVSVVGFVVGFVYVGGDVDVFNMLNLLS